MKLRMEGTFLGFGKQLRVAYGLPGDDVIRGRAHTEVRFWYTCLPFVG